MKLGRSEALLITLNLRMGNFNVPLQADFEWGCIRAKLALQKYGFMLSLIMISQRLML